MKYALQSPQGIDNINQGIGSIFKTLALAPMIRQQAEDNAALRGAQTYSANMAGNKYGAEAAGNQYTLDMRKAIPDRLAADPSLTEYAKRMYEVFQLTGDTNAERVAKAGGEFQTQGIRQQAVDNVGNLDTMNRYNTLAQPGQTYEPFKAVGDTGRTLNAATGTGNIFEGTLRKIFDAKVQSEIGENNAQAGNANASADQHRASKTKIEEETTRLKAGGPGKPLTASQLRENTAIAEARELVASMTQADVDAVLSQNPQMMTAQQRDVWNVVQRARKPMFGEANVDPVQPQPTPPAPAKPGLMDRLLRAGTGEPAKSAAPAAVAPTMTKPTLDQWLTAARRSNPGVPDDQLKQYYAQKYGQ